MMEGVVGKRAVPREGMGVGGKRVGGCMEWGRAVVRGGGGGKCWNEKR